MLRGFLVLLAIVALPQTALADRSSWRTAIECGINPRAGDEPAFVSPLHDDEQRELREYGHSLRLVGNKSHTRFPTHSYLAFTFDDGPSYKTTPKVLDALDKYDIPATFFVNSVHITGTKPGTLKNIATLKQTVARGFHIGNHTFHHRNLKALPAKAYKREIERGAQEIERHVGYRPYLVRFPYGVIAQRLRDYLDQEGYTEVRWNIDSSDYKTPNRTKLRIQTIKKIISWNGGIVLFHDVKPWTAAELGHILDDLEALNCRRLKTEEQLLLPVSLHYYARDKNGNPRPVPREVELRTQRYIDNLPGRCEARIDKRKATK